MDPRELPGPVMPRSEGKVQVGGERVLGTGLGAVPEACC